MMNSVLDRLARNEIETERGNVLLVGDAGGIVAYLYNPRNNDGLHIEYIPENYPSLKVHAFTGVRRRELVETIQIMYPGWIIVKNNIDIPSTPNNEVLGLGEKND